MPDTMFSIKNRLENKCLPIYNSYIITHTKKYWENTSQCYYWSSWSDSITVPQNPFLYSFEFSNFSTVNATKSRKLIDINSPFCTSRS